MMEGQQGNLYDGFGEDAHLLDGQEVILDCGDIWWSQPSTLDEVPIVQEIIGGVGLPNQQVAVVSEVADEVDDMHSYFLRLSGGDELVQLNLERIFDSAPNDLMRQDVSELYLVQEVYQSPQPPSSLEIPPPPQQEQVLESHLFSGLLPGSGHVDVEIPAVEGIFSGQAPTEQIAESVNQGLNLEKLNLNPVVLLERLPPPPRILEERVVTDSSSSLGSPPPPLVQSPLKNSPFLVMNPFNKHHAPPPPLIKRPEAVRHLPPPPPLVKRPEVKENQNLSQESHSLRSSIESESLGEADIRNRSRSRLARGYKRKNFISHSLAPPTDGVEGGLKKKKINYPEKKEKSPTVTRRKGWVEGDVWEYEKIIEASLLKNVSSCPTHGSQNAYYVKWKGWSSKYNNWLPEKDFVDPWPLGQFWKTTLENVNKLNQKIKEIPAASKSRQNYFMS